jgi:hypothetical protein
MEKIIILAAAALIAAAAVLGYMYYPVQTTAIGMHLTVGNYTGFDVNTSALFFGTVAGGGISERYVDIGNEFSQPLNVQVFFTGDLAPWASASEAAFRLDVDGTRTVNVSVHVPAGAEPGDYSGTMEVVFRR